MGGISTDGIDLNQLTNGRYDSWGTLLNNAEWLGRAATTSILQNCCMCIMFFWTRWGGTEFLRVNGNFNTAIYTTAVLFTALLAGVLIISFISVKTFNIGLYIFSFILIGMFEYSCPFMFVYFSPVALLFVILGYLLVEVERVGQR